MNAVFPNRDSCKKTVTKLSGCWQDLVHMVMGLRPSASRGHHGSLPHGPLHIMALASSDQLENISAASSLWLLDLLLIRPGPPRMTSLLILKVNWFGTLTTSAESLHFCYTPHIHRSHLHSREDLSRACTLGRGGLRDLLPHSLDGISVPGRKTILNMWSERCQVWNRASWERVSDLSLAAGGPGWVPHAHDCLPPRMQLGILSACTHSHMLCDNCQWLIHHFRLQVSVFSDTHFNTLTFLFSP